VPPAASFLAAVLGLAHENLGTDDASLATPPRFHGFERQQMQVPRAHLSLLLSRLPARSSGSARVVSGSIMQQLSRRTNGGYLKSSPSTPHLTRTSAA
jgi:hypothetical protein